MHYGLPRCQVCNAYLYFCLNYLLAAAIHCTIDLIKDRGNFVFFCPCKKDGRVAYANFPPKVALGLIAFPKDKNLQINENCYVIIVN